MNTSHDEWLSDFPPLHDIHSTQPPTLTQQPSLVFDDLPYDSTHEIDNGPSHHIHKKRIRQVTDDLLTTNPLAGINGIGNAVTVDYTQYKRFDSSLPLDLPIATEAVPYSSYPYHNDMDNHDAEYSTRHHSAPLVQAANVPQLPPAVQHNNSTGSSPDNSSVGNSSESMNEKEFEKKLKHQQTDRHRRQKIKEGMDQLKSLVVPASQANKADQAAVVQASVNTIQGLKDQVSELQKRLAKVELDNSQAVQSTKLQRQQSWQYTALSNPISFMMPVLNAAGVAVLRMDLAGRLLEVNMVFEMLTGYRNAELVGRTPCHAPLYCALSVVPPQFLSIFNNRTYQPSYGMPEFDKFGHTMSDQTAMDDDTKTVPSSSPVNLQQTPADIWNKRQMPDIAQDCTAQKALDAEQETVYEALKYDLDKTTAATPAEELPREMLHNDATPSFLLAHLQSLPPNHVLKLMNTCHTKDGGRYEYVASMTLVRTPKGAPDFLLSVAPPDARRVVRPPASRV